MMCTLQSPVRSIYSTFPILIIRHLFLLESKWEEKDGKKEKKRGRWGLVMTPLHCYYQTSFLLQPVLWYPWYPSWKRDNNSKFQGIFHENTSFITITTIHKRHNNGIRGGTVHILHMHHKCQDVPANFQPQNQISMVKCLSLLFHSKSLKKIVLWGSRVYFH